ncbi:MAG: hypothetical protein ACLTYW_06100 [Collinsella sp.]
MLVSTTVVEVGVDVPNAIVMVSRTASALAWRPASASRSRRPGGVAGTCLVMTHSKGNGGTSAAQDRLQSLEKTSDGFTLAQMDLRLATRARSGLPSAWWRDPAFCRPRCRRGAHRVGAFGRSRALAVC